ncbi:MAG: sulfatase-like hydrolase/transferase [Flavobacteriia bacterium]|nr:sulfatase-like hydrolase/transferase [Flavobacteriia bacterium]
MHQLKNFIKIPNYIKALLLRFCILLLFMFLARIVFYIANKDSFLSITFNDSFISIWFDIITISIVFLPYYALYLIPFKNRENKFYKLFFKILFHTFNCSLLFLNLIDVEYFQFTNKRSTSDLFTIVGAGNDISQLLTSFITDFWWLILCFILFILFTNFLYKKTEKYVDNYKSTKSFWTINISSFFTLMLLFIVLGRGSIGVRPISVIDASRFTNIENTALILNTPFTMLKSIGKEKLEEKKYFSEQVEKTLFNPIRTSNPQNILPDSTNVVIIMLESFGNEFVGKFNKSKTYTPFFDSILNQSLTFEYGISNGKKSIEAVPAILASIPTLMDNPYISSSYNGNKINTLPSILTKFGYSTAFFHGATNGSMKFNSFASQAGFQKYFGRFEYNNDAHFDKTWGILDEYFNPWTAKQITKMKAPFFATLFTLSSHHPYYIPPHMKNKVKKGNQPICASINYGDYSLKKFFEEAKKQPWFNNTLFVLCADHTPATNSQFYSHRTQMYRIPIAFYHPKKLLKPSLEKIVFQQIDIFPTILDLLNIHTKYYSFGNSYFESPHKEGVTFIEGSYQYFFDNYMLTYSNDKARNLYDFTDRNQITNDLFKLKNKDVIKAERRLKAIIQCYNRDLIKNQTTVE